MNRAPTRSFNSNDGHYFLARPSAVDTNQLLGVIGSAGKRADMSMATALASLCTSDTLGGSDIADCISIFTMTNDDGSKIVRERGQDDKQE
jgi:hypothetical protein